MMIKHCPPPHTTTPLFSSSFTRFHLILSVRHRDNELLMGFLY